MTKTQLITYWREKAESYRECIKHIPPEHYSLTMLAARIFEECAAQLEKSID